MIESTRTITPTLWTSMRRLMWWVRSVIDFRASRPGTSTAAFAGPFDVTPDWHPILDEAPGIRGFYLAVGFSGHGFKLAPAVGEMVADLVINGKQPDSD